MWYTGLTLQLDLKKSTEELQINSDKNVSRLLKQYRKILVKEAPSTLVNKMVQASRNRQPNSPVCS